MIIKWTPKAHQSFDKTVDFIEDNQGIKSAIKFVRNVNKFLDTIKDHPRIGKPEIVKDDLRSFVISRNTTVFYRLKNKETIIILKFFDTRQSPEKKWE